MDIYEICFLLSTFWVGPFWFAMLINPREEKTKRMLKGPWFYLGPIIIWYILMALNPQGLIDLAGGSNNDEGFLIGLANALATKPGVTATWAHMVAGDFFVTRWIWLKCIENNANKWIMRLSIFFGVMLMPIGLAIYAIFVPSKSKIN
tara:strand:+ start:9364 stop:9807 length:444 start_codon:yes stop_codon:yes gene_type:complete